MRCPACGDGKILPVARPGRTMRYHAMTIAIPATISIPTCDHCGEEWIGDKEAAELDEAAKDAAREKE